MKSMTSKAALLAGMFLLSAPIAAYAASSMENDAVLDDRGAAVITTNGTCVRTNWTGGSDPCAAPEMTPPPPPVMMMPPPARPHPVIALDQRTVTFAFDKSDLTDEARGRLDTLADLLKADYDIKSVDISGYADRIGSTQYNEALSMRRADAVRDYLTTEGVANARTTQTRWFGKSDPKTNCPAKLKRHELIACLQKDRRVEVEVVYQTTGIAPRPAAAAPASAPAPAKLQQHFLVPPATAAQPQQPVLMPPPVSR